MINGSAQTTCNMCGYVEDNIYKDTCSECGSNNVDAWYAPRGANEESSGSLDLLRRQSQGNEETS